MRDEPNKRAQCAHGEECEYILMAALDNPAIIERYQADAFPMFIFLRDGERFSELCQESCNISRKDGVSMIGLIGHIQVEKPLGRAVFCATQSPKLTPLAYFYHHLLVIPGRMHVGLSTVKVEAKH
eukprot:107614-Amphidinium_carterae.1